MNDPTDCVHKYRWMFAAVLLLFSPLVSAESLGRLFLSPEQRSVLERQRQLNIVKSKQEASASDALRLNGIVRHSSGKATVWVNGQARHDNEGNAGIIIRPAPGDPSRVIVRIGAEAPVSLRIGETLNRNTRGKSDPLAGGQVHVKTPHAEKPALNIR